MVNSSDTPPARRRPQPSKPGRKLKGGRRGQITSKVPETFFDTFCSEADAVGLHLVDYSAILLYRARGVDLPDYLVDQLYSVATTLESKGQDFPGYLADELTEALSARRQGSAPRPQPHQDPMFPVAS